MNKVLKIVIVFIIIFATLMQFNRVYASNTTDWTKLFSSGDDFIKKGFDDNQNLANITLDEEQLKDEASGIFKIFVIIGIIFSVIVGGILGIKFMMASAEDKAPIKEALIPYIVGCVVVYGAFAIWRLVIIVLQNI